MARIKPVTRADKAASFDSLIAELMRIDSVLPRYGLERLRVFNGAYLVITKTIAKYAQDGYFAYPKFIETFTISFAHYYLEAVNTMRVEPSRLPEAWRLTHEAASETKTPNAVVLLMGANAHINHDLPLVLAKLISEKRAKELFTDVLTVDKILMRSGKAIIPMFREQSSWQNWAKDNLRFLYYRPTMWMVLYWRIRAWKDSRDIAHKGAKGSHYARRSVRVAKNLRAQGKIVESA